MVFSERPGCTPVLTMKAGEVFHLVMGEVRLSIHADPGVVVVCDLAAGFKEVYATDSGPQNQRREKGVIPPAG